MTTQTGAGWDGWADRSVPAGPRPQVPGYETGDLLGVGSTGSVWSAVRECDGTLVALKVVRGARPGAAGTVARELGVLGRAAADHLVRVHDALVLPDGDLVLVLDHLAGGSLRRVVAARGHLTPGETVTVLSPVAAALGRLHVAGVVHGDVSPGNVLLDRTGRPVLADLGTARLAGEQLDEVRGTEGFIAPEVLAGGLPGTAADVYAVGALGWLCLTGDVPGPGPLRGPLAGALRAVGVADVEVAPGYARLVELIEACLDPSPEARPDADELAVAVFDSAQPRPIPVVTGPGEVGALTHRIRVAALGALPEPSARHGRHAARTHGVRRVVAVAAAVLILLGGVAVASLVVSRGASAAQSGPVVAAPVSSPSSGPSHPDPTLDRAAPRTDPTGLLGGLVDRRADAWRRGRVAGLTGVDAPASAPLARDTRLLAQVQQGGLRYVGLRFVVARAEATSVSTTTATIRARIDTTAYTVEGEGSGRARPPQEGVPVLVDLVWTDEGWRIADLRSDEDGL